MPLNTSGAIKQRFSKSKINFKNAQSAFLVLDQITSGETNTQTFRLFNIQHISKANQYKVKIDLRLL